MNDNSKNELAKIFIGLGDEKRIKIIKFLGDGETRNIDEISQNTKFEINVVKLHLNILIDSGLVKIENINNKNYYHMIISPILEVKEFCDEINSAWGEALWSLMKSIDD